MRVSLIAYWFQEFCALQATALAEHAEVTLLFPEGQLGRAQELLSPKVKFVPIPKHGRRSVKNLLAVPALARLIGGTRPDIVHAHANGHARLMLALPLLRGVPLVISIHDPTPHPGEGSWVRRWANRAARRRADQFVLHGRAMCDAFEHAWGIPRERISSIMLGALDYSRWRDPALEPPARGHALLFGRMQPYKGGAVLIDAAARLRCPPERMKIVIAGRGSEMPELRRRAEALGLEDRVLIIDQFIPEPLVDSLHHHARAVVLPYTEATQSGPAVTALGHGKPIIASAVGGLPEVCRDGETGILVPPGDPDALAAALDRIAESDALAERLGAGAKRLGETELSWAHLAEQTVAMYRDVIARTGRRRA